MRHMLLAYNKLSFSQVYKLYKSLQEYYHSHCSKPSEGQVSLSVLAADDSDMDLTSTEDTVGDRMESKALDTPLHLSELRLVAALCWNDWFFHKGKIKDDRRFLCVPCFVLELITLRAKGPCLKNKQSTFLHARWAHTNKHLVEETRSTKELCIFGNPSLQAYLMKNDENKALKPAELQEELNNMLKFNPDFAEAVSLICWPFVFNNPVRGTDLPPLVWSFCLSTALPELLEQHESPRYIPLHPQSSTLFWPLHFVWKRWKEQRRWRLRTEPSLRCSEPGEPPLPLWSLVSTSVRRLSLKREWFIRGMFLILVSRLIWRYRRPFASPRSLTTTCACSTVW